MPFALSYTYAAWCHCPSFTLPGDVMFTWPLPEFWPAFVRTAACSLHIRQLAGRNSHHIAEAVFKSAARTFREAVEIDPDFADEIPSTKGVL